MGIVILNLVASLVLLAVVNAPFWFTKDRGIGIAAAVILLVLGLPAALMTSPAVLLQALLMALGLGIWARGGGSRRRFLKISFGSLLVAHLLAIGIGLLDPRGFRELRRIYPLESLEPRLAGTKPEPAPRPMSSETRRNLDSVEEGIPGGWSAYRSFRLEQLHEDQLYLFIVGSGFGVARMSFPNPSNLESRSPIQLPVLQPTPNLGTTWPSGVTRPSSEEDIARMNDLLVNSVVNFVNPEGFGYFQDRRHVAGFEPHRFSRVPFPGPGADESWKVERLELVSLLLHEVPAVYISDRLPAMNEARKQPTRHLDSFETLGLYALRDGRELYIEQTQTEIRMLGAIRASKHCLGCHEAEEADLLGAFSYRLRAVGP